MTRQAMYMDCSEGMAELLANLDATLVGNLECHQGDPEPDDLFKLLKGFPLLLNGHTRMSAELLKRLAPELKRIVFLGTGAANYIDIRAAAECGIEIITISNYGDRSVAEHAFALLLAAARDVAIMDREIRQGLWARRPGNELKDKLVGIAGYGGIGREMAAIAHGFGMNVLVWNRSSVEVPEMYQRAPDLRTLFESCDAVSLHLGYSTETRRLIGREYLQSMRPASLLINTARAELVDPDALHEALTQGPLAHAAVDVFEPEPPSSDDPLLRLPNVTLTAHTAWMTPEASRRLLERGLEELWN